VPNPIKLLKNIQRAEPGNLISVNSANEWINVYIPNDEKFSFSEILGSAKNGELGVVLKKYTDNNQDILYHYVKVAFCSGIVGIVHSGLIKIVDTKEENKFSWLENLNLSSDDE
jgi:hypothetical protein